MPTRINHPNTADDAVWDSPDAPTTAAPPAAPIRDAAQPHARTLADIVCARVALLGGTHPAASDFALRLEAMHRRVNHGLDASQLADFDLAADQIREEILHARLAGTIEEHHFDTLVRDLDALRQLARR